MSHESVFYCSLRTAEVELGIAMEKKKKKNPEKKKQKKKRKKNTFEHQLNNTVATKTLAP